MNINGLALPSWLQPWASALTSQSDSSANFSLSPAGTAASGQSAGSDATATSPSSGAGQLASGMLSALISVQSVDAFANQEASNIINAINPGGSSISLAQVESALTGGPANSTSGSSSTSNPLDSQIAQAFAQLDTNGDGQLSQGELAAGLESMGQSALQDIFGHHRHHHHGGEASNAAPTSSSSNGANSASTSQGSTAGASSGSSSGGSTSDASTGGSTGASN